MRVHIVCSHCCAAYEGSDKRGNPMKDPCRRCHERSLTTAGNLIPSMFPEFGGSYFQWWLGARYATMRRPFDDLNPVDQAAPAAAHGYACAKQRRLVPLEVAA